MGDLRWAGLAVSSLLAIAACEATGPSNQVGNPGGSSGTAGHGASGGTAGSSGSGASGGSGGGFGAMGGSGGSVFDGGGSGGSPFDPDAACAVAKETAVVEKLPVDIIWVVDSSASMQPAITQVQQGINDFASTVGSKDLDYKVIMLALRGRGAQSGGLYGMCVPEPLAGDAECGNGPRFFQSSINIHSTQPLEQLLGTLGDTSGYHVGQQRGPKTSEDANWRAELRPEATRSIVIVTDDNSRLTASHFETWGGGGNWASPLFNGAELPPGVLDPSWGGLFDGYTFSGIYGWGSETNPATVCSFPGGGEPPASGRVYTELVQKTGGVRAQICDGAPAWGPFFDQVATAVEAAARINCELAIPQPSTGELDPGKVNVAISSPAGDIELFKVSGQSGCGTDGGWYYDDDSEPTEVILCPSSCEQAQSTVVQQGEGSVDIYFGCESRVK